MCDYSLHAVRSMDAMLGDVLVTAAFENTYTRGFAMAAYEGGNRFASCAICLKPGTELVFDEYPRRRAFSFVHFLFSWLPSVGRIQSKLARFRHINEDDPYSHHDALEFANGEVVLLDELVGGSTARVIQMPVSNRLAPDDKREWTVPRISVTSHQRVDPPTTVMSSLWSMFS